MEHLIARAGSRGVLAWWSWLAALGVLETSIHAQGNVSVRVDGAGNLIVEGDAEANGILIKPFDVGEGDVVGLGTTLVNGGTSASFSAVVGDFRIRMRGGDDEVHIDDGDGNESPVDLEIETGPGDDHVLVRHFLVHGDLLVRTGGGNDTIELVQTAGNAGFVEGRTEIRTGAGDDSVLFAIGDLPDTFLAFEDDFELRTGAGRDFVSILGARFAAGVQVDLGAGDDMGELEGVTGGLCVCGSVFEAADVLSEVRFLGGSGQDGGVAESVCGIAPPGLLQDFLLEFEFNPDDCSYLGGEACATSCE